MKQVVDNNVKGKKSKLIEIPNNLKKFTNWGLKIEVYETTQFNNFFFYNLWKIN